MNECSPIPKLPACVSDVPSGCVSKNVSKHFTLPAEVASSFPLGSAESKSDDIPTDVIRLKWKKLGSRSVHL